MDEPNGKREQWNVTHFTEKKCFVLRQPKSFDQRIVDYYEKKIDKSRLRLRNKDQYYKILDLPPKEHVDRGIIDSGSIRAHDSTKVLFTKTENDLFVSSDFKILMKNQILLKVPRHHNMYSFDMKTPTPAKEYLTDSMNYIPVSLENQANPHAGASEVTNSAGTSQTPNSNASEERDEDVELIVVPSTVKTTEEKAESRQSSSNSKKEEILTEPQQEKKVSSTDTSEDNPKILAFRRELEEIALKHLGKVSENNSYSTS
ncbi:hypothetical protein Tco_0336935 [Tanacetum coccineum]